MKTPREVAHELLTGVHDCESKGRHGHVCEATTATITARDADHAAEVARLREALGVAAKALDDIAAKSDRNADYAEYRLRTFNRAMDALARLRPVIGDAYQLRPLLDGGQAAAPDPMPPTGLEPRGCPMPGACACPVAPIPEDEEMVEAVAHAMYDGDDGRPDHWLSWENSGYGEQEPFRNRARAAIRAINEKLGGRK